MNNEIKYSIKEIKSNNNSKIGYKSINKVKSNGVYKVKSNSIDNTNYNGINKVGVVKLN